MEKNFKVEELFYKKNNLFSSSKQIQKLLKQYFNEKILSYIGSTKFIAITGTNGKGTTANYIYQYLIKTNHDCALFISPHIYQWEERIQFNGAYIEENEFIKIYNQHEKFIISNSLNFFQIFFLVFIFYCESKNAKIVVIEYGIGAKNDCCNIFDNQISLITSIGLDHENILGKTKLQILKDKFYISRKNSFLICNINDFYLNKWLIKKCEQQNVKLLNLPHFINTLSIKNYFMQNFLLAYLALKIFLTLNKYKMHKRIYKNTYNLHLPGRNEIHKFKNKKIIIDSCHNIEAIKLFLSNIKLSESIFFVCLMKDKNIKQIINFLIKKINNENLFFYKIENPRCVDWNFYKVSYFENLNNIYDFINNSDSNFFEKIKSVYFIGTMYSISEIKKTFFYL